MKTSEVLRKAGDVLRERGWNRGWFVNDQTGALCLMGACNVAVAGDPIKHAAEKMPNVLFLLDAVTGGELGQRRATWNDAPGRSAEDVHVVLDGAYVLALQEEGVDPEDVL